MDPCAFVDGVVGGVTSVTCVADGVLSDLHLPLVDVEYHVVAGSALAGIGWR